MKWNCYINIHKSLKWILGKKSILDIVKTPSDATVAYFYVDLFPWLSWSRGNHKLNENS